MLIWLLWGRISGQKSQDFVEVPIAPPDRVRLDPNQSADEILIDKSQRKLWLKNQGAIIDTYEIALGFSPTGHKSKEGDGKTPIGVYEIDWRNPDSSFHRSLHISYPTPKQVEDARLAGINPGGMIMIHGQPNGSEYQNSRKIQQDWTNGCIAVSNDEMDEIWQRVPDGTRIIITE